MTAAPSAANFCAATAPIPDDAPVSKIRLSAKSTIVRADHRGIGRIPASRNARLMSGNTARTPVRRAIAV
jgi:hypothetical protein